MKRIFSSILFLLAFGFLLVSNAKAGEREDKIVFLALRGDVNGVQALLDQGVDVNARESITGFTALHVAAQKDHADVVLLLLARGADINAVGSGSTAIYDAALNGHADIVRILIDKGADINKKDEELGYSPLMIANEKLEKGNATGMFDKSYNMIYAPLTPAEKQAYTNIVQMLKAVGAK